jgi:hypothetical protein
MKPLKPTLLVLVSAFVITFLFYKQALGLNLLIYELMVIGYLSITKQLAFKGVNQISTVLGVILTGMFTVIHHSTLSFVVNVFVFILFVGVVIAPELRSLISSFKLSMSNLFKVPLNYWNEYSEGKATKKKSRVNIRRLGMFFIPILIVAAFTILYSWSSPKFSAFMESIANVISENTMLLFQYIDLWLILTFVLGLFISAFIFIRKRIVPIIEEERKHSDDLVRERISHSKDFKLLALKNEKRSAVFLFASLNLLLLLLNILDVDSVWMNFEWEGQHLKQFVHFGTYILIFTILISIALVLYVFRNNLNFYRENKVLKVLCYVWLAQNILLALSVGIRNWHYIEHFALAYKRIGVLFFLLLAVFGLITVAIKVRDRKSHFYILRINALAWVCVFTLASGFNWDRIIAKYNFSNAEHSFVHLNFLATLSDSALPELDKSKLELSKIRTEQLEKFSHYSSSSSGSLNLFSRVYMTPDRYFDVISMRKQAFKRKWESKGFLSWNFAEYRAYEALFGNN